LLSLLSGDSALFPDESRGMPGRRPLLNMPLDNVMFIACGAFAGLSEIAGKPQQRMGFQVSQDDIPRERQLFKPLEDDLLENTVLFSKYGIIPELMGRFSRIVPFQPLDRDTLKTIV